ncbi:MAG: endonuclease III domain-containing protein [Methanomassiliicoccales archaeon]|nr:endonuclease III domain-containing protein [Methanomassiliicoccales archaeon]
MKLLHVLRFEIQPIPPYDFDLTVHKPAGWSLFSNYEKFEKGTMWTATHLVDTLTGVKLVSKGTVEKPRISTEIYLTEKPSREKEEELRRTLIHDIGADEDLSDFYAMARKDDILRLALDDLCGMHNTMQSTVFPDASLAILLQMAPMKRSGEMMDCYIKRYGDAAEFDCRKIWAWPRPEKVAKAKADEMAETCKLGYRAKRIVQLAKAIDERGFPTTEQLEKMSPEEAKARLLELPGIGDYSADIINPHGGFPIDVWSADVFGLLFFGKEPANGREVIEEIKAEGLRRWDRWSWMAFYYVVQDLGNLSRKLKVQLRLS